MTGKKCIELAAKHLGEKYVLGAFAPKNNEKWEGPWDCAEFCSWVIYQTSGILYGVDNHTRPDLADAYTGYFANDAHKFGEIIDWRTAAKIPGALLVRKAVPKLIGHVVFADGLGGTYEARGAAYGVAQGQINERHWDLGILIPGLFYDSADKDLKITEPADGMIYRIDGTGMKSSKTKEIQRSLLRQKPPLNPGPIDGIYGQKTAAAVFAYQLANGLVPDGQVGPETAASLGIKLP